MNLSERSVIPDWAVRTKADEQAIKDGYYWDQNQADRIINFTEKFFVGQVTGPIKLLKEQKEILQALYGWRKPNGTRRWKFANLHVCKKAIGKTLLCAILCYYELFGAGEHSPTIYSAACSRENAAQIFDELEYSITHSPFKPFANIKTHSKIIQVPDLNGTFKSCASEGKRLHGPSCTLVVLDECHEHQNNRLWNALRWSTKARPNGLVLAISTAGSDLTHFYYKIYQKSKRIISGEDLDPTHFAYVCEMDQDGNPEDPEQWKKANPLIGNKWCTVEDFKAEMLFAKSAGLGEWLPWLRLNLNKWVRADEYAFFDVSQFDALKAEPTEDELAAAPASIGCDISEVTDPTSVTITWQLSPGHYYSRSKCWISDGGVKLREKANLSTKYAEFIAEGSMSKTPGDMLDEREVMNHLIDLVKAYNVKVVNFDPRSAYVLANRLAEETGVTCERVPPSAKFFNPAMRELHKAIEEKRYEHDGNSWLKFCLQNVRVEVNKYEEVYPVRKRSVDKIDCAISACLSLLGLLTQPTQQQSEITWG